MRSLTGSLLFWAAITITVLSPVLIGLLILVILGMAVAAAMDLFTAIRGGSGSSGGREYWTPGR